LKHESLHPTNFQASAVGLAPNLFSLSTQGAAGGREIIVSRSSYPCCSTEDVAMRNIYYPRGNTCTMGCASGIQALAHSGPD
jgi:hypothetical protein